MSQTGEIDAAFLVLLFFFGTPILADTIASAICNIKIPFRKQE